MGINFILVSIIITGLSLCGRISCRTVNPVAVRLTPLQTSNTLDQYYSIWNHPQESPQYDTILSSGYQFPVARHSRYGGRPSRELVPIPPGRLSPPQNHQSYVLAVQPQQPSPRPYLMSASPESSELESDEESPEQQQQDYAGSAYYPDYFDYEDDDDDDEVEEAPKKKKKKKLDKFEKIDRFIDKIHNKIYDKYLHIKEKKPPEPPDWAKDKFGSTTYEIDLPPWEKYVRK